MLCGLYRLGEVELPFEVETLGVVRDADAPEAAGTATLWRGVVRLACQMHGRGKVLVTTRPDAIGAKAKDANDLLRMVGVDKVKALMATAQKIPPFSEFERGPSSRRHARSTTQIRQWSRPHRCAARVAKN